MKLLMCPPLYYRQGAGDRERALSEWRELYRLLRDRLRVEVELLEPRPGLPGLVHVAMGGYLTGDTLIVSGLPEGEPLENFFLVRGYKIKRVAAEAGFGDPRDMVPFKGALFKGLHGTDARRVQDELAGILGGEIVGLELTDRWRRPLATCLCPIGEEVALCCPAAFTDQALARLESRIPRLVRVEEEDGGAIACASLVVGGNLMVAEGCRAIHVTLERLGLEVYELPLEEYRAEGGPKTLALQIES